VAKTVVGRGERLWRRREIEEVVKRGERNK